MGLVQGLLRNFKEGTQMPTVEHNPFMAPSRRAFLLGLGATAASLLSPGRSARAATLQDPSLYVASLTPLNRDGSFDEGLARDLLTFFQAKGVDGILVLGSTGEFSSFSVRERRLILEKMVQWRGGMEIICNASTPNIPETLSLLKHAAETGADKALLLPPFYFKKPSREGLESFFTPLLEASPLPVMLYHIPGTSGVPITIELVKRLARCEQLYGIKDSSGDEKGLMTFIREFPRLKILTGSGRLLSKALEAGGAGAITGNSNLIPEETVAVFKAFRSNSGLAKAQRELDQATRMMPWRIPEMKFALGEIGLRETFSRPPFNELTPEEKRVIKSKASEYLKWRQSLKILHS